MSLKAKLEAVTYAAEEPVTLAQLAALFVTDALDWKAKREAASALDSLESTDQGTQTSENLSLLTGEFEELEHGQAATDASAAPASSEAAFTEQAPTDQTPTEQGSEVEPDSATALEAEAADEADAAQPEDNAGAEADARRIARVRDREARAVIRTLLDELIAEYTSDTHGVEIREIAGGFRMATKPECHDAVRSFVKSLKPALRLSLPALETLAVIAYKQPVTAPEVNEIRGVDSSGVFGSLLARKLIATAGRKQVIGRPILYKTTREFLLRFGLKDVAELPSMEEFEKMAAIELDEQETLSGEEPDLATTPSLDLSLELDETAAEDSADDFSTSAQESPESTETAVTADSHKPAGSPAIQAESTPAEAAPAAPSPTEQAETETFPHDEKDQEDR